MSFDQTFLDTATQHAADLIADWEQLMLNSYHGAADRPGVWTLGYGQITWNGKTVVRGMSCTADEARAGLLATIGIILPKMAVTIPSNATPWQLASITSFAYNEGSTATLNSTLMRKWRSGDVKGAADQFPIWDIAAGKTVLGLDKRRAAERALFLFA